MNRGILTINAGSSSIKFALFPLGQELSPQAEVAGQIDGLGTARALFTARDRDGAPLAEIAIPGENVDHGRAFDFLLRWFTDHEAAWQIAAVGHRVVHGGEHFAEPTVIDAPILERLAGYVTLAPLHQPHNLAGIRALQALLPGVPQVACFDTAFHRSNPAVAQTFGLPRALTAEGVRRYGFHGLSYEYIARVLPQHSSRADGRVVVAHLGNGASMAALVAGRGVASTMGFTAIDGLVMGTRTGALDPGVLLYLMDNKGLGVKELTRLLYKESGLLGVSGLSQDMRTLLASDRPEAAEAVDLFCYRIVRELGSLAAAAGGVDVLVFTGGIGEHAAEVRRRVCARCAWLGITLDDGANARNALHIGSGPTEVLVIPTNEEWMIADHTRSVLGL
ncbi:MAG: acetate/propionate family kinase [Azonexus sp.]|jgi:acetate kinase|nr:acetate/propionate family kinase [Betaproteobacteria bacterium]MBK8918594.1 acetate/propionate family kinase [Betaproteobacteria bacterium]MBP6034526.1 acetate/propionate family kinase [Azonexus sp.]MBP6905066.1 acetate/propionate family kinase [Azonexus sp.]